MSDEDLSRVLSKFVDNVRAVIEKDIPRYYNADENDYFDIRERMIACGYEEWLNEE
jgi:hypothetical protein